MLIVQKFGGSSLADLRRLRRAASLTAEARRRGQAVLVVVSAAGDSTDELLALSREITARASPRELDALLNTGEQRSAALMAIMLQSMGVEARSFTGWQAGIRTDRQHGRAAIREIELVPLCESLARGEVPVVAGFQGIGPDGALTTLGRGGSDTSAVALASALEAARCEIFTDVDGIYTADPRLVPEARLLTEIDYRDMLALARAGSQVLHPESVRLALARRVELLLLSSFTPAPGTRLALLPERLRPDYAGVTRDAEADTVTLVGRAVSRESLPRLGQLLEDAGIRAAPAQSGEGCASLTVAPAQQLDALRVLHGLCLQ